MAKMNIGVASMQIKCRGNFMAKEECWCGFITKANDGGDFIADASANIASVNKVMVMLECKCKCWRSFMTKISDDTVSMQRKIWMQLHCEGKC